MNITVGIYSLSLIFIYIVIPGFFARRFYYHGEFSKQINLNKNPAIHFVSSAFVGLVVFVITIIIKNNLTSQSINFYNLFETFYKNFLLSSEEIIDKNNLIIGPNISSSNDVFYLRLSEIVILNIVAITLGYFFSKIIIFTKLDIRTRILRFNNDWYYIFNGKSLNFNKKFEKDISLKLGIKHTYLDVLTNNKEQTTTLLYSGLLKDYELCTNDNSKIEKLYLQNTVKYDSNVNPISIPGNLFLINGDSILNINCRYEYYDDIEHTVIKKEKIDKIHSFFYYPLFFLQITSFIIFISISLILLFKIELKDNFLITQIINKIIDKPIWYRLLILFLINQIIGYFICYEFEEIKKINFKGFQTIFLFILFSAILIATLFFTL